MGEERESHDYVGRSVPRVEDARLLAGRARFVDDLRLPNMAHAAILRSEHAHARIEAIDLAPARAAPGVLDAFAADDLGPAQPDIPLRLAPFPGFERFLQRPLAALKARYVGEPVAVVVARDRYRAEDALARIAVRYEPLPALVDADAAAGSRTLIHDAAGANVATSYRVARGDVDAAFARADYRRAETFRMHRQTALPLETRGLIADFDAKAGRLRLWGATKVTYFNRRHLAAAFGLRESDVELIEADVGGGFGARGELYPEDYLVPIASRRAGRPVKWVEDRREHMMASNHSREMVCEIELAAARDGTILGMRGSVKGDMGAYIRTNAGIVPARVAQCLPGPYRIPAFTCEVAAVITNKTPTGTYRGPGGVEASFVRERLIDMMAEDLGLDPAQVRLRNLIAAAEMPFRTGELIPGDVDAAYDPGDYSAAFRRLLDEAQYDSWKNRQGETDGDGRRHGLGLACFVESTAFGPPEYARVIAGRDGRVEVRVGASAMGQGLETTMAQVCASALQIPIDRVTVRYGTTSLLEDGGGTFASRNAVMCGNAVRAAADELRRRCLDVAALRWNADAASLRYADGAVWRKTEGDHAPLALADLAAFAEDGAAGGLAADGRFDNEGRPTHAHGCHAAHVAVDVETGAVEVIDYVALEDVGRMINPAIVHGQAVGGVIQGLGGALLDRIVYGAEGELLTANLADYLLPSSTTAPEVRAITLEDAPSTLNAMGVKGAGEGAIVAVAAAVGNAIAHALARDAGPITRTPFDPESVRRLVAPGQL
jgi:carbon-monoxide dehydrogenase large subunit